MNIKITRKKIKNLILKINDRGEIIISAPYGVSEEYIYRFVDSKKNWIEKRLEALASINDNRNLRFETGEKFILLGKEYTIKVAHSHEKSCNIEGNYLIILTPENTTGVKEEIVKEYVFNTLKNILVRLNNSIGKTIGFLPHKIRIRDMKTRWGSCNSLKKSVTYNLKLYTKPIEAIEYVVLHELSHIPYPHHQKEFWNFVSIFMPDYKEKRRILKER